MIKQFLTKAHKATAIVLFTTLTLAACKYDDSALWEQVNQNTEELAAQAARIAALEAWQAETNTNIEALQTLLSTTDYITAVTPVVKDGVEVGFTISFLNTPAITIYHGTKGDKGDKGDTPQIGATQADDGNWYWTLNGEFLTDTDGNPIRANGTQGEQGEPGSDGDDAPLPQLATGKKLTAQGITTDSQNNPIAADAIYLSVDGGKTWTRVSGEKGNTGETGDTGEKGDSFFESVDTTDPNCVTFTLANEGGSFSVPRYVGISLTFSTSDLFLPHNTLATIQCTVTGIDKPTKDNLYLITVPDGWKVVINDDLSINVTAPTTDSTGEILVMLDNKKGSTTIGRIKVNCNRTYLYFDHVYTGKLAELIGNSTNLTAITVTSGEINDKDWEAIKQNKDALTDLDLAGTTYTGGNAANLVYSGINSPLQNAKLPQGVTGLGEKAFSSCKSLKSILLPASLTSIGDYAFSECKALTSINIPDGVTSIGGYAFYLCYSLPSIDIPDGLTNIGYATFSNCSSLTSIDFPAVLKTIDDYAFYNCFLLKSIEIPSGVTSIGMGAFGDCNSLSTVTFLGETPPVHTGKVFYQCTALSDIYVPAGSVDAYKETWSEYADKISAITEP